MKAVDFPMGYVLSVIENSLGETTQATLRKGNGETVSRDVSCLIPFIKNDCPSNTDLPHREDRHQEQVLPRRRRDGSRGSTDQLEGHDGAGVGLVTRP